MSYCAENTIQLTLSVSNSQGAREFVRDRERKIGYSLHKGTETLVRDREKFEIESVRDRESQLYCFYDMLNQRYVKVEITLPSLVIIFSFIPLVDLYREKKRWKIFSAINSVYHNPQF